MRQCKPPREAAVGDAKQSAHPNLPNLQHPNLPNLQSVIPSAMSETPHIAAVPPPGGDPAANTNDAAMAAVVREVTAGIADALGRPLAPGLYLVATPIGNLEDISLRAVSVLARADVIFCEDTRHSARLLQRYGIATPTRPLHEHNEDRVAPDVVGQIQRGQRIAVISDAGTPLVSDPGFRVARAVMAEGLPVHAVPGASALLAGLSLAGLPADTFLFAGFLPAKGPARRSRLSELQSIPATLVFFESPHRLGESLADMAAVLGDRPAAVGRELTKRYEEVARASLNDLAVTYANADVRGECVVLVGRGDVPEASDETIAAALAAALQSMRLKDAAVAVAETLGVPKNRVYAIGLDLKARAKNSDGDGNSDDNDNDSGGDVG